ncbi:MAG: hypothetical protein V4643_13735 [Bacteroidota bacterium]
MKKNTNNQYAISQILYKACFMLLFLSATVFITKANNAPNILIFKNAELFKSSLFVLGKNNSLYCLDAESGASKQQATITNIKGIYQYNDSLLAWNDHQIFSFNSSLQSWEMAFNFESTKIIKSISAYDNELVIAFADGLLFANNKDFYKAPFYIKSLITGPKLIALTNSNFIYEFTKQHLFVKSIKLDSAKTVHQSSNGIIYNTEQGLRIYNLLNKQTDYVNNTTTASSIIGTADNMVVFNTGSEIAKFNMANAQVSTVIKTNCNNASLLSNGNILYNNTEGQCLYYVNKTNTTLQVGSDIKSFSIIDYYENESANVSITSEGFIFNKSKNKEQQVIDLSLKTGRVFGSIQVNNNLVLACEKGLFLFNTITNEHHIYSDFKNVICNGITKNEKYIYVCSAQQGILKFRLNSINKVDVKADIINKGLMASSAYIIKNFDGLICTVTSAGVYQKEAKSDQWIEFSRSGFVTKITGITYYKKNSNVLFIASAIRGVVKTNDDGNSYEPVNLGLVDSIIVNIESDSNGFYALNQAGDIYFHDHDGIQWVKIDQGNAKYASCFLRKGILFMIDHENNITKQITSELKPRIEVDWQIEPDYVVGERILIPFKTFGFFGKDNHTVLQLTKANTDFDDNYVDFSDDKQGQFELIMTDSLTPPGEYTIRLVGTEPFVRSEKTTATFKVIEKRAAANGEKPLGTTVPALIEDKKKLK